MGVSSAFTVSNTQPVSDPHMRIRGWWLALAWAGWSVLALLSLIGFVTSIHEYLLTIQTLCRPGSCIAGQPTPETAQTLGHIGLSVGAYAALSVGLVIGAGLTYCVVAVVIVWRKPTDWMVLLATNMLIIQGLYEDNYLQSVFDNPSSSWHVVGLLLSYISPIQFLFFCAFFPNGRPVPRWVGWLLVALSLIALPPGFFPAMPLGGLIETLFVFSGFPLIVGSMIYRYRDVSTPVERQQTKWVVFGVALVVFAFMLWFVPQIILFSSLSQPGSVYDLIGHPLFAIAALFGPICIATAVLRYRLWDIDTLINKALVYSLLTGILGALYAGLIIGLEGLAGLITGLPEQQPVVLVISTLAIAALFQPLRRRIQSFIDRRFYRRKYDAEKTLAAFSVTLHNEVDLEQMREQVVAVVNETLQPAHISLWLRQPERHRSEQAHRPEPQGTRP